MSERLPYEEQLPQQLRDFPLPDENAAWEDMRRRLEEDDDDGVIVWWRRGCAGWGLLLLGLLALGWWTMYENGIFSGSKNEQKKDSTVSITPAEKNSTTDTVNHSLLQQQKTERDTTLQTDTAVSQATPVSQPSMKEKKTREQKSSIKSKQTDTVVKQQPGKPILEKPTVQKASDSTTVKDTIKFIAGDSAKTVRKDSARKQTKTDTTASNVKKKTDSLKKKEIFFSAGLGLNQQIPVAGQKAVPYGSQGRKFSLADYIPSVYLRLNKKDKWFIQGEFRYGAPQYTKPLLYFEKVDTGGGNSRTTTKQLQKTYYHQLPLSFNYYVSPNWSIGAGLVWNKFSKSVYEEAVRDPNSLPDSFITKQVMTSKQPQAEGLSKSYFQGLFETQYQWKRFSFGARYTFGLQPYIKFTLPGQPEQKERNQSLQVFLRYELWRSLKSK